MGTEYNIFNGKEYVSLRRFWDMEGKYKTEKAKNEELEEENKKLNIIIENTKKEQKSDREHIEELEEENKKLKDRIAELEKCNLNLQEHIDKLLNHKQ